MTGTLECTIGQTERGFHVVLELRDLPDTPDQHFMSDPCLTYEAALHLEHDFIDMILRKLMETGLELKTEGGVQ